MAPKLTLLELNGFAQEFEPNGKISTVSFVNSSYEVISIIESLGHLFYPVVLDMKGNVDHLQSHYKEDEERRKYIEDMVLNDEQRKTHSRLLWLNRALEMIDIFFYLLLNDEEVLMEKSENIRPLINQAYNEALKPYHGFFLQNAFKLITRCMPTRSSLLGTGTHFQENINHMKILQPRMRLHIEKVVSLFRENNLNDSEKA